MIYKIEEYETEILLFMEKGVIKKQESAITYLDQLCRQEGSTLQGRVDAMKEAMQIKQKVPVFLGMKEIEFIYPLYGTKNKQNIWLSYRNCVDCKKKDEDTTEILLINGECFFVKANIRIVQKQMKRCRQYLSMMQKNMVY